MSTKYSLAFLQRFRSSSISRSLLQNSNQQSATVASTATESPSFSTDTKKSVADFRKEYSQQGLIEDDPIIQTKNPFKLFQNWFEHAVEAKLLEPNAMCLSTCVNNRPSARYVLLKGYDERGFVWYTNYQSRKSQEIKANPNAALTFFWVELERSVRIEGRVEVVSEKESDDYFQSRPRGSQIGAWTSKQSQPIESRLVLEHQEQKIAEQFTEERVVPRPPHWGGFRLIPDRIEFWKGRQSRLHDRLVYERKSANVNDTQWTLKRLQP